jgi:peptidoglycan/xylan/chitin deacetylase (PgdA/CDA1 family)
MPDNRQPHLSRREFLKLSAVTLVTMLTGNALPALAQQAASPVLYRGSRISPYVALTYDDCYLSYLMLQLEQILTVYPNVKVTFFPIGYALANVERQQPGIWKRLFEQGHEFGYHAFGIDHFNAYTETVDSLHKDYENWYAVLAQVLESTPPVRFARPPFNALSDALLQMYAERGLIPTQFSGGWSGDESSAMAEIRKTKAGDIIQMHIRSEHITNTRLGLAWHAGGPLRFVTLSRLYQIYLTDLGKKERHKRR